MDDVDISSGLLATIYTPENGEPKKDNAWDDYHITTNRQEAYKKVIHEPGKSPYASSSDGVDKAGVVTLASLEKLPAILAGMDPVNDQDLMVMAVRAALAQAQDASALNTQVGVGYNTYPNPFVCKPRSEQTIKDRYTGREFILLNRKLEECQEYISIELEASNNDRSYLKDGWC